MQSMASADLSAVFTNGALSVALGVLVLGGGWPEVDGKVYRNVAFQTQTDETSAVTVYDLGAAGRMEVRIAPVSSGKAIKYSLKGAGDNAQVRRFGLHFDSVAGMKRYYRSGYHSWDGSYFVQPDALSGFAGPELLLEKSYGITELIPADGQAALVAGFDRHDRYQQVFNFGARKSPVDLSIGTLWDLKAPPASGELASETLYLLGDADYEEGLRRWARIVAAALPAPPPTKNTPLVGWGTWYNLYNFISDPSIQTSLQAVSTVSTRDSLPIRTFLIDAGFTPELGDWLKTSWAFPNGMAPLITSIKNAGFTPALWIAPHLVGNRSQLYRDHPDWVLLDASTGKPKLWAAFYGEQRLGTMRSEEYYILDTTVPEALDYLRTVFRTWKQDWGVQAFKVDFSYLGADYGPDEVTYRTPGMTRIEVWRRFAEMVRQEIGDDGIWIGSGQPLWAGAGLSDTVRIAGDVGVVWTGNGPSALPLLQSLPFRNFANHILWQIDPDALLLRTQYHYLTDAEVRSLALFAGMSGGVMMTSDDLDQLPPDRISLWKMLLSNSKQSCAYPRFGRDEIVYVPYQAGDGQPPVPIAFTEPVITQVRKFAGGTAIVHILNTSAQSQTRTFSMSDLALDGPRVVNDWFQPLRAPDAQASVSQVTVTLEGHGSSLLYMTTAPVTALPVTLGAMAESSSVSRSSRKLGGGERREQDRLANGSASLH